MSGNRLHFVDAWLMSNMLQSFLLEDSTGDARAR